MKKQNTGITLIALIITVIVLLILAGTAISISVNSGNIFGKAADARAMWNNSVEYENQKIQEVWDILNTYNTGSEVSTPSSSLIDISNFYIEGKGRDLGDLLYEIKGDAQGNKIYYFEYDEALTFESSYMMNNSTEYTLGTTNRLDRHNCYIYVYLKNADGEIVSGLCRFTDDNSFESGSLYGQMISSGE